MLTKVRCPINNLANPENEGTKLTFNKSIIMSNLLYIIAVILVIAWAIGYLGYSAGGLIHVLLVIAVIAIIFRVIQGRKPI